MNNKIRMTDREWSANLWSRIKALFGNLDDRVATIEDASYIPVSQKGAASGVAELDSGGKVPSSQLPSYVDDVLEYSSASAFPSMGETGKIYVAQDTNLTYRWTGSAYVEIAGGLALGETSSTAYRGDRGKAAYDHAQAHGSAYASGLYKVTTNSEGHVTGATAVVKSDITALGLSASDIGAVPNPIVMSDVDLTQSNNGISGTRYKHVPVMDSNGKSVGYFIVQASDDGATTCGFYACNYRNQTNYSTGIRIIFYKDGTTEYIVGNPSAFREAIGALSSSTVYVSGVKGNAESSYRSGSVNLTPANLGAQVDVGLYIDAQGYLCQRISTD